jgi:hypothetical protein
MSGLVPTGNVFAGKRLVDKVLGIGGMGVVVEAHRLQLAEKVALKVPMDAAGAAQTSQGLAQMKETW